MSDFARLLVVFFAIVNPAAVLVSARSLERDGPAVAPVKAAGAGLLAVALVAVLAGTGDRILDGLAIAPESFRVAAGIVMAMSGIFAVWWARIAHGPADGTWRDAVCPLGVPLLFGPATVVAAISYGTDDGAGEAIAATAIWVAASAALVVVAVRTRPALADALARLSGALLVVVAAGLVVDGVRAI